MDKQVIVGMMFLQAFALCVLGLALVLEPAGYQQTHTTPMTVSRND
ncbi:MAG: hypothetical protein MI754_16990 [Chromatiales bacterium]|nr:hypothetical protein [Chromatiales bacterium]